MSAPDEMLRPPEARSGQPDWTRDGADWPHRSASRFIRASGHVWHVQRMGDGPAILLVHGTGASTHSWAGLLPLLAVRGAAVAVDLPGQGFSRPRAGFTPSLPNMARDLAALLNALGLEPDLVIGHSAGAAIALELAGLARRPPSRIASLNGALKPFPGLMSLIAPAAARALAFGGLAATLFAQAARDPARVHRLLEQTGGLPPQPYIRQYQTLLSCSAHVSATLSMMANWDLSGIERKLAGLDAQTRFIAGEMDRAVAPSEAVRLARLARHGEARLLRGLGHLAHEQSPGDVMTALEGMLP